MTNRLLSRLAAVQTDEERSWMIIQSLLQSVPADLSKAAKAAAIPHWFNDKILAALCPELESQAEQLYKKLQNLSFVEVFPKRGHNIHKSTRKLMLAHLWDEKPDWFRELSARAANYFESQENLPEIQIERVYHLVLADPDEGKKAISVLVEELSKASRSAELDFLANRLMELRIMNEPIYYCNLESILNALGEKRCAETLGKGEPSCAEFIIRFLSTNRLVGESDFASSLILLVGSDQWQIGADLNISPNLENLPQIRRTGTSPPWMRAFLLGFEGDIVTDTALQRSQSLFFSTQAAIEEWLSLLFRILEMRKKWSFLDVKDLKDVGQARGVTGKKWFEYLQQNIQNILDAGNWQQQKLFIKEFVRLRLKDAGFLDQLPKEIDTYLEGVVKVIQERVRKEEQKQNLPDKNLWRNLLIALLLALDETPYKLRHLGTERLGRFIKYQNPELYNLVIQGAGELSMNQRNVAFYYDSNDEPKVFIPANEPFADRNYHCLVVWKKEEKNEVKKATKTIAEQKIGVSLNQNLSITELRFARIEPYIKFPENHPDNLKLDELVNFALYGKLILRQGEIVKREKIIDEFQDLRHVFNLPFINPEDEKVDEIVEKTAEHFYKWFLENFAWFLENKKKENSKNDWELYSYIGLTEYEFEKIKKAKEEWGNKENRNQLALGIMEIAEKFWKWSSISIEQRSKESEFTEDFQKALQEARNHLKNNRLDKDKFVEETAKTFYEWFQNNINETNFNKDWEELCFSIGLTKEEVIEKVEKAKEQLVNTKLGDTKKLIEDGNQLAREIMEIAEKFWKWSSISIEQRSKESEFTEDFQKALQEIRNHLKNNRLDEDEFVEETAEKFYEWFQNNINETNFNKDWEELCSSIGLTKKEVIEKVEKAKEQLVNTKKLIEERKQLALTIIKIAYKITNYFQEEVLPEACNHFKNNLLDQQEFYLVENFSELRPLLNRPRHIFGLQQETDVRLLEYALLSDRSLRNLACTSTIVVDLVNLGVPQVWIDFCLIREGYRRKDDDDLFEVQEPGDFCWDTKQHRRLNIRLKMNTFPCTIVGIGSPKNSVKHNTSPNNLVENDTLYLLAWGHNFDRGGSTIWDCAKVLKAAGATYALVLDEGDDVFQFYIEDEIWNPVKEFKKRELQCRSLDKWMRVPIAFRAEGEKEPKILKRHGLRASLAFWQGASHFGRSISH